LVTDHCFDWRMNTLKVTTGLALIIPGRMKRGIGMNIDPMTGALSFIGDSFSFDKSVEPLYEQVKGEIKQTYIALATMQALAEMGYNVQATQDETQQGLLVLQGVAYA
ncbi:MAG TPA: hypothetical protein VFA15_01960, partial [Nitrososphaera sp.]|nr:hypothetical protein [Nitrososphaera sp.]